MTGVDYAISHYPIDSNRLAVAGYSYGGFLTAWSISQSKRFKVACIGAGIMDFISFVGTSMHGSFLPGLFGPEFYDNYDFYLKKSPIFYIKKVDTPTLIQQGNNDEIVPPTQSLEFYNALKKQGVEVKMIGYPNCTHGYYSPKLYQQFREDCLEWIEKHLK